MHNHTLLQRGEVWWVQSGGTRTGPYSTRLDALRAAIARVDMDKRLGEDGDMALEHASGEMIVVYTSIIPS